MNKSTKEYQSLTSSSMTALGYLTSYSVLPRFDVNDCWGLRCSYLGSNRICRLYSYLLSLCEFKVSQRRYTIKRHNVTTSLLEHYVYFNTSPSSGHLQASECSPLFNSLNLYCFPSLWLCNITPIYLRRSDISSHLLYPMNRVHCSRAEFSTLDTSLTRKTTFSAACKILQQAKARE